MLSKGSRRGLLRRLGRPGSARALGRVDRARAGLGLPARRRPGPHRAAAPSTSRETTPPPAGPSRRPGDRAQPPWGRHRRRAPEPFRLGGLGWTAECCGLGATVSAGSRGRCLPRRREATAFGLPLFARSATPVTARGRTVEVAVDESRSPWRVQRQPWRLRRRRPARRGLRPQPGPRDNVLSRAEELAAHERGHAGVPPVRCTCLGSHGCSLRSHDRVPAT